MNILSGHIIDGFRSIFNESLTLCEKTEEPEKYLMTFQNLLSRIPKWNQNMIETECSRIKEVSNCNYLDDLITCVHVIQLKILSCVRTSNQIQKIDIDMPSFNHFLHNVYINIARKLYSNIYLFQVDITPLEQQKNNREFENIVQTSIMNSIRDNIPIDQLLKQYIDETQEDSIEEKVIIKEEPITTNVEESNTIPSEVEVNSQPILPDNISFKPNVETYDSGEKKSEPINFESKSEPGYLFEDEEDDDTPLKIGEPIQLNLGESFDIPNEEKKTNELTSVDLNALPFEDKVDDVKNDIIDLNVEEIRL
jgi:hypothetical protein